MLVEHFVRCLVFHGGMALDSQGLLAHICNNVAQVEHLFKPESLERIASNRCPALEHLPRQS